MVAGIVLGVALVSVRELPRIGVPTFWAIVSAFGVMLIGNWASRALYRARGGWKIQLTYLLRASLGWEALTDAGVASESDRLGSPVPACAPDQGWRNRRTNLMLLWFTDAQGVKCEVAANLTKDPRIVWAFGFAIRSGKPNFASVPRSSRIVLFARVSPSLDPVDGGTLRQAWSDMGGDELQPPVCAAHDLHDGDIIFECSDPLGNAYLLGRGTRTRFHVWRLVGPMLLMYRDFRGLPRAAPAPLPTTAN